MTETLVDVRKSEYTRNDPDHRAELELCAPVSQAAMDYQRIAKAIAYLQAHFLEQPELAEVARAAHMSEYHFQRVFSRWAGISPKRFLQFLTVEHAKAQLDKSKPVLEAALDAGLSGPGRLHDLFVGAEAVTPGEFKSRGAGIHIRYGFHATPFGRCLVGVTSRGVCWLSFLEIDTDEESQKEMKSHWSGATFEQDQEATAAINEKIFSPAAERQSSRVGLLLMGTNFQLKVWQALLKVPQGALVTYQDLGRVIRSPKATQAIGNAVASNSIAYLIPCHRVIRKSGVLGGYRWGPARKLAMMGREAAVAA